jgi:Tfp pilus assembly protein PilO
MRTGQSRLWLIGGTLGAVALLAIGWFLFVGPQYAKASSLRDKTTAEETRVVSLQHRLTELRQQKSHVAEYEARLARESRALPTESGLSDFLRELQTIGDSSGVSVSGVIVAAPNQASGGVFALPITLTVSGAVPGLTRFLDELQQVQPRAVFVTNALLAPAIQGGTLTGKVKLTLGIQVFVASKETSSDAQPAPTKS